MADQAVDLWATDEVHFQQHGSRCHWKLTRRLCVHNRYFPKLDVIAAVEAEFDQWTGRNETLRRLCAIP
jgi:hypothetical protein